MRVVFESEGILPVGGMSPVPSSMMVTIARCVSHVGVGNSATDALGQPASEGAATSRTVERSASSRV